MKKSKFSEAQIAFIPCQADEGTPVTEVCRKAGISDATFYNWRKRYGGLTPVGSEEDTAALTLWTPANLCRKENGSPQSA